MHFEHKPAFLAVTNRLRLEALACATVRTGPEWNFHGVVSPFNRLYLVTGGSGTVKNSQSRVTLRKGWAYLVPLQSRCNYSCPKRLEKFYLHFRWEIWPGRDVFRAMDKIAQAPVPRADFLPLLTLPENSGLKSAAQAQAALIRILSRFIPEDAKTTARELTLLRKYSGLFTFLSNHSRLGLRLDEIAADFGVSAATLSRSFKRDSGLGLKQYIGGELCKRIKDRLLLSDKSIKEIAAEFQFDDEFYLSRFFKKHAGLSPREYRRRNRIP
jgi:AraC-like DNA-binding protein